MFCVSIIIPTYNHRDFIVETLESVFAQTFLDYEIIVINDGSPDDTDKVLLPFIEQGRIQYIEQKNQGQASARNRGLAAATGEFIAFLDDDDLWPKDKLEWQVEFLREHPEVGVIGGACEMVNAKGDHLRDFYPATELISFASLFSGSPFASPGQTLIRASYLKEIGGLNAEIWGTDDFDLWFRLVQSTKILARPRIALRYRIHPSNASKDVPKMFTNFLIVIKKHLELVSGPEQLRLSRNGYRCLYTYAGRQLVTELKANIRTWQIREAAQKLRLLIAFAIPVTRDFDLGWRICKDFCLGAL